MLNTIETVKNGLASPGIIPLPAPIYEPNNSAERVMLAVEDMRRHTADAGWQLTLGLQHAGYNLAGYKLPIDSTHIPDVFEQTVPGTCVLQDKREWDMYYRRWGEPNAHFTGLEYLRHRNDVFKLTVVKDAHQHPLYHRQSAEEIDCHGWITYYHPGIVQHVAPYLRMEHCIRTTHSVDSKIVPTYSSHRPKGCLLSGAVSVHYPLRRMLISNRHLLPDTTYVRHPGYRNKGCCTPNYLMMLHKYKVAICTSSKYGYALRKIIEATACGCVVITDLPVDDVLPEIDDNLVRVGRDAPIGWFIETLHHLYKTYDSQRQKQFALKAQTYYDYRAVGKRLARNIDQLKLRYNGEEK